jgi:hypothetical protein
MRGFLHGQVSRWRHNRPAIFAAEPAGGHGADPRHRSLVGCCGANGKRFWLYRQAKDGPGRRRCRHPPGSSGFCLSPGPSGSPRAGGQSARTARSGCRRPRRRRRCVWECAGCGGVHFGRRGFSKDHRPEIFRWLSGSCSTTMAVPSAARCGRATPPTTYCTAVVFETLSPPWRNQC